MKDTAGAPLPPYPEWLEEFVALRDESGTPYTRRQYYETFFNDIDPKKIYEQDMEVGRRLSERDSITDS